jgi:hypothetical protein
LWRCFQGEPVLYHLTSVDYSQRTDWRKKSFFQKKSEYNPPIPRLTITMTKLRNALFAISLSTVTAAGMVGCAADGYNEGAKTGAVAGGALGALGGAIIGNQSGRALEGAAIGGAAGAVGGGVLGSAQDDRRRRADAQYYGY